MSDSWKQFSHMKAGFHWSELMGRAADSYRTCLLRNPKMAIPAVGLSLSHILQLWGSAGASSSFSRMEKCSGVALGTHTKLRLQGTKTCAVTGGEMGLDKGRVLEKEKIKKNPTKHFLKTKITTGSCPKSQTEQTARPYVDTAILKNNTNTSMLSWKFRQNAPFFVSTKQTFVVYI